MGKNEHFFMETSTGQSAIDIRKTLGEHHFRTEMVEKMKEKKERLGLSYTQLSASTGIPKKSILMFFTEVEFPLLETVRRLAQALNMEFGLVDKD